MKSGVDKKAIYDAAEIVQFASLPFSASGQVTYPLATFSVYLILMLPRCLGMLYWGKKATCFQPMGRTYHKMFAT